MILLLLLLAPFAHATVGVSTTLLYNDQLYDARQVKAPAGRSSVALVRNNYVSVNVTTSAYVQMVSSLTDAVNEIDIFDSSGQTLVLATGAPGSEVDQAYIFPGGNGPLILSIASGQRVSIKAVSGTANSGEIDLIFLK